MIMVGGLRFTVLFAMRLTGLSGMLKCGLGGLQRKKKLDFCWLLLFFFFVKVINQQCLQRIA